MHLWWEGTWDLSLSWARDWRAEEAGRAGVVVNLQVIRDEKERLGVGGRDEFHARLVSSGRFLAFFSRSGVSLLQSRDSLGVHSDDISIRDTVRRERHLSSRSSTKMVNVRFVALVTSWCKNCIQSRSFLAVYLQSFR